MKISYAVLLLPLEILSKADSAPSSITPALPAKSQPCAARYDSLDWRYITFDDYQDFTREACEQIILGRGDGNLNLALDRGDYQAVNSSVNLYQSPTRGYANWTISVAARNKKSKSFSMALNDCVGNFSANAILDVQAHSNVCGEANGTILVQGWLYKLSKHGYHDAVFHMTHNKSCADEGCQSTLPTARRRSDDWEAMNEIPASSRKIIRDSKPEAGTKYVNMRLLNILNKIFKRQDDLAPSKMNQRPKDTSSIWPTCTDTVYSNTTAYKNATGPICDQFLTQFPQSSGKYEWKPGNYTVPSTVISPPDSNKNGYLYNFHINIADRVSSDKNMKLDKDDCVYYFAGDSSDTRTPQKAQGNSGTKLVCAEKNGPLHVMAWSYTHKKRGGWHDVNFFVNVTDLTTPKTVTHRSEPGAVSWASNLHS